VTLGNGCRIGPHVLIEGDTELGPGNSVGAFSSLGVRPQDLKYDGGQTRLLIGANNRIREYVNISVGSNGGNNVTVIGDNNFLMSYVHIAHDCVVGNSTIFANAVTLAGHVEVGDYAVMGGLSAVHQFTRIGAHVMLGGLSAVKQDVPPYVLAAGGYFCNPVGINSKGLSRRGFSNGTISSIKKAFRIVYQQKLTVENAVASIEAELIPSCPELIVFTEFLKGIKRGLAR
jgi:UDP-N-acetylglucosamine acyltransferase